MHLIQDQSQETQLKFISYIPKIQGCEKLRIIASSSEQLELFVKSRIGIKSKKSGFILVKDLVPVKRPFYLVQQLGIWFEHIDSIIQKVDELGIKSGRFTQTGAGTKLNNCVDIADIQLKLIELYLPNVAQVNLGGGLKISRNQK
ncbi:UNKNOWN [Stylonychia lemnae]|uniref:Uncharacterized protein n=1 Tax=Stylonychia lemnae TaxID=5949 RepID=A0A078A4I6_STYLE|nr:UNKNOWN [Stylonychia lemnae]|eukprot:CDW77168.1 UNKNOWN [Stylonychia lemnae]